MLRHSEIVWQIKNIGFLCMGKQKGHELVNGSLYLSLIHLYLHSLWFYVSIFASLTVVSSHHREPLQLSWALCLGRSRLQYLKSKSHICVVFCFRSAKVSWNHPAILNIMPTALRKSRFPSVEAILLFSRIFLW